MDNKIKEMLEKQLELLSERSSDPMNTEILLELTESMCKITRVLLEYPRIGI